MPYFERKPDTENTRRFSTLAGEEPFGGGLFSDPPEDDFDDPYDDGFDDLYEDSPEDPGVLPEEENPGLRREARLRKFRIAAGIGDLGAVLAGAAVILILVAFLISMLRFVSSDFSRTFSVWKTRF